MEDTQNTTNPQEKNLRSVEKLSLAESKKLSARATSAESPSKTKKAKPSLKSL
jgi:hypothetical protein